MLIRLGLEPATSRMAARCSTNWATGANIYRQETTDFISAHRSLKKTISEMIALQHFSASITETKELEEMVLSEIYILPWFPNRNWRRLWDKFGNFDQKCPIKCFKEFTNHRTEDMKKPENSSFHGSLSTKGNPTTSVNIWYKRTLLGKNQFERLCGFCKQINSTSDHNSAGQWLSSWRGTRN